MLAFHRPLHTSCPARLGRRIHRCDAPASRRSWIHDSPDFASAYRLGGGRDPAALHPHPTSRIPSDMAAAGNWNLCLVDDDGSSARSLHRRLDQRYGWTAVLWASLAPGLVSFATGFVGLWKDPIRWRPLLRTDLAGLTSLAT